MTYTLNWDDVKDNCKNMVPEIRIGIETKLLSNKIQKEMEAGVSLEEILCGYLPNAGMEDIQEDAAALKKGVEKVYAAKDEEVDARWVKEHLNSTMLKMNNKERVVYLSNIILAEKELHADIQLEQETVEQIKALRLADMCTEEDVAMLLELANDILDEHAGLLTQISWKAMEKRMYKLDYETVEEYITFGEDVSIAYAAALYIQQKCGKAIKINPMGQAELPAELIGSTAATTVESSRLMQLYCRGRIDKRRFVDKIKQLYTAAVTFVCEHKAAVATQAALAIGAFLVMFSIVSELLIEMPVVSILVTAAVILPLMTDKNLTYDIEETLNNIWVGMVEIWENMKNLYHETIAKWKGTAANVNEEDIEEDIFEAEIHEFEMEDEFEDEPEFEDESDLEDEIDLEDESESEDEFE